MEFYIINQTNLIVACSTEMNKWGVNSITNENARKGAPSQIKNFRLPSFLLDGSIESETYPNMNPEKAIAIFPTALPIPLNSAGIAKISL